MKHPWIWCDVVLVLAEALMLSIAVDVGESRIWIGVVVVGVAVVLSTVHRRAT